ncbi:MULTISPECIES: class Ib ribonucleoside-diphosphate reductase assembly flavoprotein NrdI [Glutamicibacter]|jgi:protein involved in ribonucleotide reduction|uniref:Protein NrdI n=1 Tax=Glutamicibacter nicotianae TaxID=37929 RepID=A0ABQ0RGC5_GLUNI|nr:MULTISPECIES: class Ib ribonucleoside-diphosphate reductase assembly flavoprotein NrdI [Glutamicibacter]MDV2976139.1 class Ib ribonucleoside-diphosphate reductase assembly flavoprotein NrdI [Actinomycetes bacterium ARC8]MBM7768601.1 protein involved in ribonucleotide reduction [Glutamicibacter nicotianae]QEP07348.1 class Ib ribonucleoside-diphosphate reductase assembly flavoprotein NrdI [Glutamicibacter sp. ZJUTW]WIV42470.1 class Ib ribonucleoside-diphosphate reductase assembly flavoprotein 
MAPAALADRQNAEAQEPLEFTDSNLIYFSSVSENTKRFVEKLEMDAARIPVYATEPQLISTAPYVLLIPTYGGEQGKRSIMPQIMKFLRHDVNRANLRGVIGAGNTNFGEYYCIAAKRIAEKCNVPVLYTFEIMGTSEDVLNVKEGLETFWTPASQNRQQR